jgi:alginate O-acetyltransferase complex protein AlgI
MTFSSNFFLFFYLPLFLVIYVLSPAPLRNRVLLVGNLLFYFFDSSYLAWLILAVSIVFNHALAVKLDRQESGARHRLFVAGIAANLVMLMIFKYLGFLWGIAQAALNLRQLAIAPPPTIELPIGISFYTFQAISYLVDVYRRVTKPAQSLADFGAYHSLFPQLIAGPIVRYVEIENELYRRRLSVDAFADGLFRFCLGLGKKLILADPMGTLADRVFGLPPNELTAAVAWLGVMAYTLQIYYDFSGYSDMAIGLGWMLGFKFPENFNQPYRSHSFTEFWRRWHMTLSRWFRDYVYIPLGGNRRGNARTYVNLFVVFFLCGLWHGAGYTFVIWGLYHGAMLTAERLYSHHVGPLPRGPLSWLATLFFLMIGWVFFRSADLAQALHFLATMFGFSHPDMTYYDLVDYLDARTVCFFLIALLFAFLPFERFSMRLDRQPLARAAGAVLIFLYAAAILSVYSFNPFIYFRF